MKKNDKVEGRVWYFNWGLEVNKKVYKAAGGGCQMYASLDKNYKWKNCTANSSRLEEYWQTNKFDCGEQDSLSFGPNWQNSKTEGKVGWEI